MLDTLVEHHYAEVNGVRLHYVSAGPREAPLLLFVHGFPEFWMAWEQQLPDFARDYYCVAPDLRGFNLSAKPPQVADYHPKLIVEDLRQLIRHLGRERALVVAHDWGGAAAWNLAAQFPQCVEKLVILNSPHPVTFARELAHNPAQQAASEYMLLFRSDKAERVMRADHFARLIAWFEPWMKSRHPPSAELLDAYRAAWSQPGALNAGLNYYRVTPLHPPAPDAPGAAALKLPNEMFTVRVPTLVIWGMADPALLPGLLDGLDECVPDLRIERIPGASHWVAHEEPERVNALIRAFIGG
jgi:epoxide hydrolase 4